MLFPVYSRSSDSKMAKLDERIGFIGGGNMGFAIGYGLINRGIYHVLAYYSLSILSVTSDSHF